MGIILKSELSGRRTRLVVAGMYLLLFLGAVTMVHPFLVMVSGSFKSKLDQYDFDAFPRFLHDDDLLVRKYLEAKCNESADILKANYRTGASGFADVPLPAPPPAALLADWEAFRRGDLPALFYQMGFAAPSQRTVPRNVRAFRDFAGRLCGGDPAAFAARFGSVASHWAQLYVPYENPLARTYQLSHEPLLDAHQAFKCARPADERIPSGQAPAGTHRAPPPTRSRPDARALACSVPRAARRAVYRRFLHNVVFGLFNGDILF